MKKRIEILLAALLILCSCQEDVIKTDDDDTLGLASVFATIGEQNQSVSRASQDPATGSYLAFTSGDELGLFATKSLRSKATFDSDTPTDPASDVNNLMFKLDNDGKWGGSTPLLVWDTQTGVVDGEAPPADIYAYYPYQSDLNTEYNNYGVFISTAGTIGTLQDVLSAERTTVQNNNPAVFLTFKHRFALLHLKLGTGMGAVTDQDAISAIMNEGVATTATIQKEGGVVKLAAGTINEFTSTRIKDSYYVIIPAETFLTKADSLELTHIRIGAGTSPAKLATPITPYPNMVYHLTMHKGSEGSINVQLGYIEQWTDYTDLPSVREEGGIYWASDLVRLVNLYNSISGTPNSTHTALSTYGDWDETNQRWVFKVLRNIDMLDLTNSKDRNCVFNDFYGVFDGGGYTISGLEIATSGNAGLFANVQADSQILDLTLKDVTVSGTGSAGALAAVVADRVTISNCHVTGASAVSGGGNVGGLIGEGEPDISRSSASVQVEATANNAGGLIGNLGAGGSITNSNASGTVNSTVDNVGGLAGNANGKITDSHAACDVTGVNNVGGLAGNITTEVTNSHSVGNITGTNNVGGLLGNTTANVTKCSANGSVTGTGNVGGLIGKIESAEDKTLTVEGCFSRSEVEGTSNTGGLIGSATTYVAPVDPVAPIPPIDPDDPDDHGTPGVAEVLESGIRVEYSYATNGVQLKGTDDGGLFFCYSLGTSAKSDDENHCYEIPLSNITPEAVAELLAKLNSGSVKPWTIGTVIVNGKGYSLPVLTNY